MEEEKQYKNESKSKGLNQPSDWLILKTIFKLKVAMLGYFHKNISAIFIHKNLFFNFFFQLTRKNNIEVKKDYFKR